MTTERYTHLLDWLLDGYGHCQRGTEEWCKGYLDNARAVIIDQDAELARLRAENERLREALEKISRSLEREISYHRCTCPHPCEDYFVWPGPCGARAAKSYRNIAVIAHTALNTDEARK